MTELISSTALYENLSDKDLILLDASLSATADGKRSAYQAITISGARPFDLKENFSDRNSLFPNTIPSASQFERECRKLGINRISKIVVFDNMGTYSSPRAWWTFKVMGHDQVSVLNGGLPEWIREGFSTVEKKEENYNHGDFEATFQKEYVKTYQDVLDNINSKSFELIDARSEGRFMGIEKEPRKYLKSGHIQNSINIPHSTVLDHHKFKSESELKEIFESKCQGKKDLVFSCGSGLTACIVMLASEIAYKKSRYVYDGSWAEWVELQNLKEKN